MKNSIIRHPKRHPLILIHKWQIEACDGDRCAAALLSFFEYWHNIKLDAALKARQANDVAEVHGDKRVQDESLYQFHNEKELEEGIMLYGKTSIGESLKLLVKKKFISIHKNPSERYKFDRTRHFLFHSVEVQAWIDRHYPPQDGDSDDASAKNGGRSSKTDESTPKNDESLDQNKGWSPELGQRQPESSGSQPASNQSLDGSGYSYPKIPSEVAPEVSSNTTSDNHGAYAPNAGGGEFKNSILTPSANALSEPQVKVKQQLLNFAAARAVSITEIEADQLVENWPAARLTDFELVGALTRDFDRYSLDEAVSPLVAAQMFRENPDGLRWFLCVWKSFKESTDAYHEQTKHKWTKTRCFTNKWNLHEQPGANWLEAELRSVKNKISLSAFEAKEQEAKEYYATLSPAQKRALDKDTLEALNDERPGKKFTFQCPEFRTKRWAQLQDPDTREWLEGLVSSTDYQESDEDNETNDEYVDVAQVKPPIQYRFEAMIGAILRDIGTGEIPVEKIDERRPVFYEDDEWTEVKSQVMLRLAAA
jgi:hypothetical protein